MALSQRGLARRLNVDQSVLSRFLNEEPGSAPSPKRPRALKLLEGLERLCSCLDDVIDVPPEEFDIDDDSSIWEHSFNRRLAILRKQFPPGEALTRIPEMCVQAWNAPPHQRAYVCTNTALEISVCLYKNWRAPECSVELVQQSLRRLRRLHHEAAQLLPAIVDEADREHHTARCHSYAGVALSYAGLSLRDDDLLGEGVSLALRSAEHRNLPRSGVWPNLLQLLDNLLRLGQSRADEWSSRAAEVASRRGDDSLRIALTDSSIPDLRKSWAAKAPHLLDL